MRTNPTLDDKIDMQLPTERRQEERTYVGEPCLWHEAEASIPRYKGAMDKRSKLYDCVNNCDGYKPSCDKKLTFEELYAHEFDGVGHS